MIKVLFHSQDGKQHCPDGFAAAWVFWNQLGERAEYIPCVYGEPVPHLSKGDLVYLVDFSYARDILVDMANTTSTVVLDHHKTAQANLAGLPFAYFDMNRSGAQMAWDYCNPDSPRPKLIDYVADRDLWTKMLPYTEQVSRALTSFPQDFVVWDTLAGLSNYVDFMCRIGEPLYQAHRISVDSLVSSASILRWLGYTVAVTSTTNHELISDVLNLLCVQQKCDFAVNWSIHETGVKVNLSLRSTGDFDVSEVAKQFGGGGHRNAAGCEVDTKDLRLVPLITGS